MTQQPFDPNAANDPNLVPSYANAPRQNTLALLAMIFGIIALPTSCFGIGLLLGLAALIMGIIALIGVPIVLAYTASIHWIFRGKVTLTKSSY